MRTLIRRIAAAVVIVVLAVPAALHSLEHQGAAAFPATGAGGLIALVLVALTVVVPAKTKDGSLLPSDGEADVIIAGALLFLGGWLAVGISAQLPFGTILYRPDLVGLSLLITGTLCFLAGTRLAIVLLPSVALACFIAVPATSLIAMGSKSSGAIAGGLSALMVGSIIVVAPPRRRRIALAWVGAGVLGVLCGVLAGSVDLGALLGAIAGLVLVGGIRLATMGSVHGVALPEQLAPVGRSVAGMLAGIGTLVCTTLTFAAPGWSSALSMTSSPSKGHASYLIPTGVSVSGWEVPGDTPNRRVQMVVASGNSYSSVASLPPAMLVTVPTLACPNTLTFHLDGMAVHATSYPSQSTGDTWQINAVVHKIGDRWQQVDVITAAGPVGGPVPLLPLHFHPSAFSLTLAGSLLASRHIVCEPLAPTGKVAKLIRATTHGGIIG